MIDFWSFKRKFEWDDDDILEVFDDNVGCVDVAMEIELRAEGVVETNGGVISAHQHKPSQQVGKVVVEEICDGWVRQRTSRNQR